MNFLNETVIAKTDECIISRAVITGGTVAVRYRFFSENKALARLADMKLAFLPEITSDGVENGFFLYTEYPQRGILIEKAGLSGKQLREALVNLCSALGAIHAEDVSVGLTDCYNVRIDNDKILLCGLSSAAFASIGRDIAAIGDIISKLSDLSGESRSYRSIVKRCAAGKRQYKSTSAIISDLRYRVLKAVSAVVLAVLIIFSGYKLAPKAVQLAENITLPRFSIDLPKFSLPNTDRNAPAEAVQTQAYAEGEINFFTSGKEELPTLIIFGDGIRHTEAAVSGKALSELQTAQLFLADDVITAALKDGELSVTRNDEELFSGVFPVQYLSESAYDDGALNEGFCLQLTSVDLDSDEYAELLITVSDGETEHITAVYSSDGEYRGYVWGKTICKLDGAKHIYVWLDEYSYNSYRYDGILTETNARQIEQYTSDAETVMSIPE